MLKSLLAAAAIAIALGAAQSSFAGPLTCDDPETCGLVMSVDGVIVATGTFVIDADGNVSMAPVSYEDTALGFQAGVTSLSGLVDPELIFGLGASNTSGGTISFSFAFNLPLGGFPTPIDTYAEVGITLTPATGVTANILPVLLAGIVDSQDLRFSPFENVDKGVDLGALPFSATGTTGFRFESRTGAIASGGPFDRMVVNVAFALTPGSSTGLSGKVRQTARTPELASSALLGLGLAILVRVRTRRAL